MAVFSSRLPLLREFSRLPNIPYLDPRPRQREEPETEETFPFFCFTDAELNDDDDGDGDDGAFRCCEEYNQCPIFCFDGL